MNARDTLSPTAARDAYLAWQAEIGGDDVVLAAPWVRRAPAIPGSAGSARLSGSPRPGDTAASPTPERPALPEVRFEPMKPFVVPGLTDVPGYIPGAAAGPEFFSEIAQRLAEDERTSARTGGPSPRNPSPAAATPMTASASPLQETLAGLKDLEAYWSYLATAYPGWFSGARVIAAEGHAAPRLAVVELAPTGGGLFTGESGALFDRMMNAIGLTRDQMYLTSLMKSMPTGRSWPRKDTARMVPVLLRELQLAQCGLVLLMGEACAQAVLKTGRSLPDL
ncbi:MAG TPA: uracil-DNA glycosylase family protein, partial [Fibrobacteria bacterium]|nr:uracil-DNA glycosylase family protein [Fibrobacteria bacterium]